MCASRVRFSRTKTMVAAVGAVAFLAAACRAPVPTRDSEPAAEAVAPAAADAARVESPVGPEPGATSATTPEAPSTPTRIAGRPRPYAIGTPGLVPPTVAEQKRPTYTAAAMRQKVQGRVQVEVTVAADGTVTDPRIVESLDTQYGLDESALEAARDWRFRPATLDGKAVPAVVMLELQFSIH